MNADPFYSWTAGLGFLNSRKCIFIVNVATRCGFVLCALKVNKDFVSKGKGAFQYTKDHLHKFCPYEQYENILVIDEREKNYSVEPEREEEFEQKMTVGDAPPEDAGGPYGFA